jgi:hypothetical protein
LSAERLHGPTIHNDFYVMANRAQPNARDLGAQMLGCIEQRTDLPIVLQTNSGFEKFLRNDLGDFHILYLLASCLTIALCKFRLLNSVG